MCPLRYSFKLTIKCFLDQQNYHQSPTFITQLSNHLIMQNYLLNFYQYNYNRNRLHSGTVCFLILHCFNGYSLFVYQFIVGNWYYLNIDRSMYPIINVGLKSMNHREFLPVLCSVYKNGQSEDLHTFSSSTPAFLKI